MQILVNEINLGIYAGYQIEKLFSSKVNPALIRMIFAKTGKFYSRHEYTFNLILVYSVT
jgi:hypothetical protein